MPSAGRSRNRTRFYLSNMKAKSPLKRHAGNRPLPKATGGFRKSFPHPTCRRRQGPFEFSCGIDMTRALIVKESLKEGEREH
jgi:hypothetical protein